MSKKFIAGAALCLMPFAASAADLPSRVPAPAPVLAAPMFTWSGFYAGVQGGWMQQHDKYTGQTWDSGYTPGLAPQAFLITLSPASYGTSKQNGFVGGGHVGYNRQVGSLVYGVEADLEGSTAKNSFTETFTNLPELPGFPVEKWGYRSSYGLQGSARARLGFAMDRTLFYVTGGLAFANVTHSYWQTISSAPAAFDVSNMASKFDKTRFGYTVGAGVAYALNNNWSLRAEYRYTDLGSVKHAVTWNDAFAPITVTTSEKHKLTSHAVRLGLSYAFGGPAPVVAKY